jgi:hypothetical protein
MAGRVTDSAPGRERGGPQAEVRTALYARASPLVLRRTKRKTIGRTKADRIAKSGLKAAAKCSAVESIRVSQKNQNSGVN